ncbi:MAG: tetratricopeptide repeat protein, partial [Phycisphaerae bacterium]|nr:tetratricopeptide repeat protein [Phycisphaerae bacterium]
VNYDSLASSLPTRVNSLVRAGEQLLAQREFYGAVVRLSEAAGLDDQNPLVWLRLSQAYFGATEYESAANALLRAMRIFPSVVTVQTALPGLADAAGQTLLTDRLAQLQRIAQGADDARLWTLLCYVQHLSARRDAAVRTAEYLTGRKSLPRESAALAKFVLAGKTPTTRPADR